MVYSRDGRSGSREAKALSSALALPSALERPCTERLYVLRWGTSSWQLAAAVVVAPRLAPQ